MASQKKNPKSHETPDAETLAAAFFHQLGQSDPEMLYRDLVEGDAKEQREKMIGKVRAWMCRASFGVLDEKNTAVKKIANLLLRVSALRQLRPRGSKDVQKENYREVLNTVREEVGEKIGKHLMKFQEEEERRRITASEH